MKLRVFKSLTASFLCIGLFTGMTTQDNVLSKKPPLKFKPDGTFKIVQFTDIQDGPDTDPRTLSLMNSILDSEKPDLVILTGDNIDGKCKSSEDVKKAIANIAAPMEKREIWWAIVFGNHDDEHGKMSKEEMMKIYMSYSHNLSEVGPDNIDGIGNYNLILNSSKDDKPIFNIYMLDSGKYSSLTEGYDWIKFSQIEWYRKTSLGLKQKAGMLVPSLMFFHIPLPEWPQVWNSGSAQGSRLENECTPKLNSGLFTSLVELGDVKGVFVGHDHINDYWGELYGIKLGYSRSTGYATYGSESLSRGGRVFVLNESNPADYQTYVKLASDFPWLHN